MKHANNKTVLWISAALDAALFVLLLVVGTHWFLALLVAETIAWLVRLVWISPMLLRFILRRLFHMIPIILGTVAIGFLLIQMAPGDIFTQMSMNPDIRRISSRCIVRISGWTDHGIFNSSAISGTHCGETSGFPRCSRRRSSPL
jgi:hypothetical protein